MTGVIGKLLSILGLTGTQAGGRRESESAGTNAPPRPDPSPEPAERPQRPAAAANVTEPKLVRRPTHEEIAARAYAIWLREGKPSGRAEAHWHAAERELDAPHA